MNSSTIQCQYVDIVIDYNVHKVQCEDIAQVFLEDVKINRLVAFCYKHAPTVLRHNYEVLTRGEYLIGVIMRS